MEHCTGISTTGIAALEFQITLICQYMEQKYIYTQIFKIALYPSLANYLLQIHIKQIDWKLQSSLSLRRNKVKRMWLCKKIMRDFMWLREEHIGLLSQRRYVKGKVRP